MGTETLTAAERDRLLSTDEARRLAWYHTERALALTDVLIERGALGPAPTPRYRPGISGGLALDLPPAPAIALDPGPPTLRLFPGPSSPAPIGGGGAA